MLVTAGLVVLGVALVIGRFLEVEEQPEDHVRPSAWSAWREPRTLAIGLVVMCFALAEGIANDWLALGIVDGYGAAPALGSFGYALFVVAMTTGRFFGGGLATRYGRVSVLRVTALLVIARLADRGVLALAAAGLRRRPGCGASAPLSASPWA